MSILLSNFMELQEWVQQLKSLAEAHSSSPQEINQQLSLSLNNLYLLGYMMLVLHKPTASRGLLLLAVLSSLVVTEYKPLFDWLSEYEVHLLLALIYVLTTSAIANSAMRKNTISQVQKKMAVGCFVMALLNIYMVVDSYLYGNIQTWAYSNYKVITSIIHGFILGAGVNWQSIRWRDYMDSIAGILRSWGRFASNFHAL